jgi:predicted nucleotidyltransferase
MTGRSMGQRAARYQQRMRGAGFVKKHIWVPEEQAARLEEIAAEMRRRYRPDRVRSLADALHRLRSSEAELRRRGVRHVAIFGSFARGDDRPDSDIDVLVSLDPTVEVGLFAYAGLGEELERVLGRPVDLANREALKEDYRPAIERDATYAF